MTENVLYENILGWTPGWQEGLLILIVVLLLFGGKKLPEFARSLSKALREFKKGLHEVEETKDEIVNEIKDNTDVNETEKES